jgi:hypothetical protein
MSFQKIEHVHIIQPKMCVYVLWVENVVSRVKKRKQTEGILGRYWGAAERKYRRLEKTR